MGQYESNDDFAQVVQKRYAIQLYMDYWGVERDKVNEVDEMNRNGNGLAELLDRNGVDKIINVTGKLDLAQRIRRPRKKEHRDLTIRRQVEQDWDAEYAKLQQSYHGGGTTPSKYAYGEVTEQAKQEISEVLKQHDGFQDVDCSQITTPIEDAISYFHLFDLERFLELEFAGQLPKKPSPTSHDRTDDPYYWQNTSPTDNGFYSWDWNQLRMRRLIEAEFENGKLVKRCDGGQDMEQNTTEPETQVPDKPHDITQWADDDD